MKLPRRSWGWLSHFLVVSAVLGFLAVCAVNLCAQGCRLRTAKIFADEHLLRDAIKQFEADTGARPHALSDLWRHPANAHGWKGPYVDPEPRDPWGNFYVLAADGGIAVSLESAVLAIRDS